jgi:hypothetical protein
MQKGVGKPCWRRKNEGVTSLLAIFLHKNMLKKAGQPIGENKDARDFFLLFLLVLIENCWF